MKLKGWQLCIENSASVTGRPLRTFLRCLD